MREFKIEGKYNHLKSNKFKKLIKTSYDNKYYNSDSYKENIEIRIHIIIYIKIPIYFSKKRTQEATKELIKPRSKMYDDKIRSLTLEALNGSAYYNDNVLIATFEKRYSNKSEIQVWLQTKNEADAENFDMLKYFKENIEERNRFKKVSNTWVYIDK